MMDVIILLSLSLFSYIYSFLIHTVKPKNNVFLSKVYIFSDSKIDNKSEWAGLSPEKIMT